MKTKKRHLTSNRFEKLAWINLRLELKSLKPIFRKLAASMVLGSGLFRPRRNQEPKTKNPEPETSKQVYGIDNAQLGES